LPDFRQLVNRMALDRRAFIVRRTARAGTAARRYRPQRAGRPPALDTKERQVCNLCGVTSSCLGPTSGRGRVCVATGGGAVGSSGPSRARARAASATTPASRPRGAKKTTGGLKNDASTRAAGARRQAKRDSR